MSRAAKATLVGSIVTTVTIVWGVHYMQKAERDAMYRGVELDTQRLQERRQRMQDLERNRERESELRAIQPIDDADKKIHQESLKRLA